jgi:protein-disulfide isomerase
MAYRMSRRALLAAGGMTASMALAGCSEGGETGSTVDPDSIDDGERPALGDEAAPVTVTVFQDFSCPHCGTFKQDVAPGLIEQYVEPGDVRYLHADFPIPVDERWSYAVASAARAVFEEAGNDGFWPFTREIYTHQNDYSLETIESVADEIADVGAAAREAADNETYRDRIEDDRERGLAWGVEGTPTVFVGDEAVGISDIPDAIEGTQ